MTDRFLLRIKAGWQDDRTTADLTSDQWYHPDSLNPFTVSEETCNTDEQNLKLELAGMVRILKTNSGYVVAGVGYRAGRGVSTTVVQREISSVNRDDEIISQTQAYDGELLTTYH